MAYQNYPHSRPMYSGSTNGSSPPNPNNAPFPYQQLSHPQHSQFYPNPYPSPSPGPSSSFVPQGFDAQTQQGSRQQYLPNHAQAAPLMGPPYTGVPDDPFKKPFLPPQRPADTRHAQAQYLQNAQTLPTDFSQPQQQPVSKTSSASNPHYVSPKQVQSTLRHPPVSSGSHPQTSSMTAPVIPATHTTQSTPTSETPSQPPEVVAQLSKLSPADQARVDALLNVNNLLLQEVQILQKAGLKTTPQSPQQPGPPKATSPQPKAEASTGAPTSSDATASQNAALKSTSTSPPTTTPTAAAPPQPSPKPTNNQRKFVEYMRRVQSNIFFLVTISDDSKQPKPPYPSHLEPLPAWLEENVREEDKAHLEAIREGYTKLRELWPDWKPGMKPQQPQAQPQPQQQQQQQQS